MDEKQLVAFTIFVEIIHRFARFCQSHLQIVVQHQDFSAVEEIVFGSYIFSFKHSRRHVFVHRNFRSHVFRFADRLNLRWSVCMIKQRRNPVKTFGSEKLFVIKLVVFGFKNGMSFLRNFP